MKLRVSFFNRILTAIFFLLILTQTSNAHSKFNEKYVVHFILDGLNNEKFIQTFSKDKMPFLKALIESRGVYFENSVANFPSVSTSLYQGFASGLYSGYSGIPNLERFDKTRNVRVSYLSAKDHNAVNSDFFNLNTLLDPESGREDIPTSIYSLLGNNPSASIYSTFRKDTFYSEPKIAPIRGMFSVFSGKDENLDILALKDLSRLFDQDIPKIPHYTQIGLYTIDLLGHHEGPYSKNIELALTRFDLYLKDFVDILKEKGILDKTLIIVSADHGMHETSKLFKLKSKLKKLGIKVVSGRRGMGDLLITDRGVSSTQIYSTRHKEITPMSYWENIPTVSGKEINLIEKLKTFNEIEFIIIKKDFHTVRIIGQDGTLSEIKCANVQSKLYCAYIPIEGDPLDYINDKTASILIDKKAHSEDRWLYHTVKADYPDAVIQLWQMFSDGRSADMIITLKKPYGFRSVKLGNHGGLNKDDMRIPVLAVYPKKSLESPQPIRSNDIYKLATDFLELTTPTTNAKDPFRRKFIDNPKISNLASYELGIKSSKPSMSLKKAEIERRREILGALNRRLQNIDNSTDLAYIIQRQIDYWSFNLERLKDTN